MTITPFAEVQFPPNISAGAKGGPGFNTTVVELASGTEQRNVNWARERPRYDISMGLRTVADFQAYQLFFYARQGKAQGFRFKDWSDYQVPFSGGGIPVMFTTDGSTATFQIVKVYSDAGNTFTRLIKKPVSGTVNAYNNAVLMTQGGGASQYLVDLTTGIITLGSTVRATTGHSIAVSCEFDVPARFDTDDLNATVNGNEIVAWDAIPIVGLKL